VAALIDARAEAGQARTLQEAPGMKPARFLITFAEHFTPDEVAVLAGDLNYWAPIRERVSDRQYLVQVIREKKLSLFERHLVRGERNGTWQWVKLSN
jgi:hypothetical protein